MIRKNTDKEKYGLLEILKGEYKDFSFSDYHKIRTACCIKNKRYGLKLTTRKMKYKNGKYFIRVYNQ